MSKLHPPTQIAGAALCPLPALRMFFGSGLSGLGKNNDHEKI
jgi:hypothetical protein